MHRLVVPPETLQGDEVLLREGPFHHLCRVLRKKAGDEVLLVDGKGGCCRCRLACVGKNEAALQILERWQEREMGLPIRLIQGLPKAEKMDLILQKGTELGVTEFSPVTTERSIPLLSRERREHRLWRWQRIVEEAAGQCRRPLVPSIHPVTDLKQALASCQGGLRLACWEQEGCPLRQLLPSSAPESAAVLIGPEGGFSATEIDLAKEAGFVPVSLGPRILRTETAGLVMAAWLQFLYGDMG
ncbi:MAG: 16S rRNA (uracil(1498)-N(3))-methyltransferase [Deltaproteobacteria bacterium]|nr:16S rRNA (uracil(1498)-N(3))-methyltransferase [Deltaproteobacteria bacterium]